jgi:hypothetical protein
VPTANPNKGAHKRNKAHMKGPTQGKRTNGYWHSAIRVAVKIIGNSNHVEDFKLRTPVLAEDMQIYIMP